MVAVLSLRRVLGSGDRLGRAGTGSIAAARGPIALSRRSQPEFTAQPDPDVATAAAWSLAGAARLRNCRSAATYRCVQARPALRRILQRAWTTPCAVARAREIVRTAVFVTRIAAKTSGAKGSSATAKSLVHRG